MDYHKNYHEFLKDKQVIVRSVGKSIEIDDINPALFNWQKLLVKWAVFKGRCALFADTGLGKTCMQVEWAKQIGGRGIIIAPLTVARQTVREAEKLLGLEVRYVRANDQITDECDIYITNYEMVEKFDTSQFEWVVLDESSILKGLDGKTRKLLTSVFQNTSAKLCCSATPAPNDITEIGRHAELLNIMTNAEMLAAFFVNEQKTKNKGYRLKGHATEKFYQWLASWGIAIRKPSDIGYDDNGFVLPELHVDLLTVDSDFTPQGMLPGFIIGNLSAIESKKVRRESISERVEMTANLVNGTDYPWVIWCGLNSEAEALNAAIPESVNIHGSLSPETKADELWKFVNGETRIIITKTSIAGFGINMQHCSHTVFCGIDYSWEQYYQAIRRFWRFRQENAVQVYVITSEQERSVFDNVREKERDAIKLINEMVQRSRQYARREIMGMDGNDWEYQKHETSNNKWKMLLGDSVERIQEIEDESVDLSVFSPPFISLYTYTPTERDMGNSRSDEQFFAHFQPIIDGLMRITKSGRNCCVHVQQVSLTKSGNGYIGIKDFRGDVIRAFIASGWIYYGETTIDKNPQAQAIRTKAKKLMFVQKNKDSIDSAPGFADYMLIFKKPGDNAIAIDTDATNEEWILWAHPVWYDVHETDTLNAKVARSNADERHMVPLQLQVIERCVRLYSNKGELVFDPFAGIGSTGYEAVRHDRRFLGIELKEEYYNVAIDNLSNAERLSGQTLFEWADSQSEDTTLTSSAIS